MVQERQRVRVGEANGDRKKFRGCTGEVVRVQESNWFDDPYVHVLLDSFAKSRVFWPHELEVEQGGRE